MPSVVSEVGALVDQRMSETFAFLSEIEERTVFQTFPDFIVPLPPPTGHFEAQVVWKQANFRMPETAADYDHLA